MSLREEIIPYIDGYGLIAPQIPTGRKGSDNGPCFTGEHYTMMVRNKEDNLSILQAIFNYKISKCISPNGMLNRVPVGTETANQEQADDYYGVLSGCVSVGNTNIPRRFLGITIKNLGFLNNNDPTKRDGNSFLIRQPQLLACMIAASFPEKPNPLHIFVRLLAFPLFWWSSLVIATACWNTDISDTDARRLSWHLIQITKPVSFLCFLASKLWYKRLYKDYANGMKGVAQRYYEAGHPFAKYWID